MGSQNKLITQSELCSLYPWLSTAGLSLGCLGMWVFLVATLSSTHSLSLPLSSLSLLGVHNEGWFDPYLLLSAFKRKVISLGVHYIHGAVSGLCIDDEHVSSVEVNLLTRSD